MARNDKAIGGGAIFRHITRLFFWALALLPFGLTVACVAWAMAQSPFAAPIVQRSANQIEASLTRAMAHEVTVQWLLPRLQDAILQEDLIQLDLLLGLALDHDIALPRDLVLEIAAINASATGLLARSAACGACAFDVTACATLAQIGACALPFELTPAGDLNALRHAGADYLAGEDIDRLDVGLALVGLGATGAVIASGGSSYSMKAGASLLRMARRLGTLTAPLAARLSALIGDAVHWERMGGLASLRYGPADLVDGAKLTELGDLGSSVRRVADNTSVAEAISLLRYVDTPQDAAQLARVSAAMGPKTQGAFAVLGKGRVFRATIRISDLAVGAAASLYMLALQLLVFCGQQCANVGLRGARRLLG